MIRLNKMMRIFIFLNIFNRFIINFKLQMKWSVATIHGQNEKLVKLTNGKLQYIRFKSNIV